MQNVVLENVRIGFRNFSGEERRYNQDGKRNFVVFLDMNQAAELTHGGWPVKYLPPREEGGERQAYLPVAVSFNNYPPRIGMVENDVVTYLDEDTVHLLDRVQIEKTDLILSPYNWSVNGKSGVKAYLKTMYATLAYDPLLAKYPQARDEDEM